MVLIDKQDFIQLLETIPKFKNYIDSLLAKSYDAFQNRIIGAISYTTKERYNSFIKKFPDILNRVPLHMIASYLGVTS